MRDVKISTLIRKSIDRSELILFRPFNVKKWLALIVIATLAGALGGGGGANLPFPDTEPGEEAPIETPAPAVGDETLEPETADEFMPATTPDSETATEAALDAEGADAQAGAQPEQPFSPNPFLIAVVIIFGLALSVVFTWLSSRFRFIWLNSIMQNTGAIREPFGRFKKEGNTLFKALLTIIASALAYALIVFGLLFLIGQAAGVFEEGFEWSFGMGLIFVLTAIVLIGIPAGAFAIFFVAFEDFLVTIIAMEPCGFRAAWSAFLEIYGQNKKDFWLYLLLKIGLGIAAVLLQLILLLGWALLAIVAGAILFGIPYFLFAFALKIDAIFWVFAVLLGIPFLVVFMLLMAAINLPFATFFRSFSLYFLSSLKSKYAPLPLE